MVETLWLVKAPGFLLGTLGSHRFYRWGAFITGSHRAYLAHTLLGVWP